MSDSYAPAHLPASLRPYGERMARESHISAIVSAAVSALCAPLSMPEARKVAQNPGAFPAETVDSALATFRFRDARVSRPGSRRPAPMSDSDWTLFLALESAALPPMPREMSGAYWQWRREDQDSRFAFRDAARDALRSLGESYPWLNDSEGETAEAARLAGEAAESVAARIREAREAERARWREEARAASFRESVSRFLSGDGAAPVAEEEAPDVESMRAAGLESWDAARRLVSLRAEREEAERFRYWSGRVGAVMQYGGEARPAGAEEESILWGAFLSGMTPLAAGAFLASRRESPEDAAPRGSAWGPLAEREPAGPRSAARSRAVYLSAVSGILAEEGAAPLSPAEMRAALSARAWAYDSRSGAESVLAERRRNAPESPEEEAPGPLDPLSPEEMRAEREAESEMRADMLRRSRERAAEAAADYMNRTGGTDSGILSAIREAGARGDFARGD